MGKGKSGSAGAVLILLGVLGGLGGWNYHRNYQLEQAEERQQSFGGYDTESLSQLAEAYRLEAAGLEREYKQLRTARRQVQGAGDVAAGVREFERVQRATSRLRNVTEELASREARVREIDQELARRSSAAQGVALHIQRLTGVKLL